MSDISPETEAEIIAKEQAASEALKKVTETNREAERALSDFWSTIREARAIIASQGVPMPEGLDRESRG